MTNEKRLAWLIWVSIFCVVGCTTTQNFSEAENPIPDGWTVAVSNGANGCKSIDGDYKNYGKGRQNREESLVQTRLDVALGHTFPPHEIPEQVSLMISEGSNVLHYKFTGPVSQSFSTSVHCSMGLYTWKKTETNQYLGDGATLDYLNREIELGKTSDGDLIVHLILEGQFSSFFVLKSREIRESWSRYKESKSEN